MDWQRAKESTVAYWRGLRGKLDELDDVELLREINAVNELCDKAKEESHGELGRCHNCIAFQQFGGCMGISLRMSEAVVDGRKEDLEELVEHFIDQLVALKVPAEVDEPKT